MDRFVVMNHRFGFSSHEIGALFIRLDNALCIFRFGHDNGGVAGRSLIDHSLPIIIHRFSAVG